MTPRETYIETFQSMLGAGHRLLARIEDGRAVADESDTELFHAINTLLTDRLKVPGYGRRDLRFADLTLTAAAPLDASFSFPLYGQPSA
jgi:hypothetical protein